MKEQQLHRSYYDVLGIPPDASDEVIAAAIREGRRSDADGADPSPSAEQRLAAYKVLSSRARRAAYDAYLETPNSLLQVTALLSRESIAKSPEPQLLYLLVELRAPALEDAGTEDGKGLPLNLALVIDRSTSMQGERLAKVQEAARLVVGQLDSDDILSIVSFSDRASVVSPAGHVSDRNVISNRMKNIEANGGTEIYQGLKVAVQEMSQVNLSRYANRLVLLTDGHTYGDEEQCLALAHECAERGIAFSAMGIGADWNDDFLDQLVAFSGGQSVFIERPEEIVEHLQQQITGLGTIYAQHVEMSMRLPLGVGVNQIMKLTPFAQPLPHQKETLNLGSVEGRSPLTLLLELSITAREVGNKFNITLAFNADIPAKSFFHHPFAVELELPTVLFEGKSAPPPLIIRAVQMLNLYRMNERVWDDVEAGHLERATERMRRLSTRLMESGQSKLAYEAIVETQRMTRMGSVSLEGRKKLKYGTRSLLTKTMTLNDQDEV